MECNIYIYIYVRWLSAPLSFLFSFFCFAFFSLWYAKYTKCAHTAINCYARQTHLWIFDLWVVEYEEKQNIKHHARTYKIPRVKKSKCQRNACCRWFDENTNKMPHKNAPLAQQFISTEFGLISCDSASLLQPIKTLVLLRGVCW